MILKRFSYSHRIGEAGVVITRKAQETGIGKTWAYLETWTITGRLLNTSGDPTDLDTTLAALKAIYSVDGGNIELLHNDGVTPTDHAIMGADTIGGIKIRQPLSHNDFKGAEYVFYRTYTVVLEALIPIVDTETNFTYDFKESLEFSGGLPELVFLLPNTGLPVEQQGKEYTPWECVQTGTIVGMFDWLTPPAPLYPAVMVDARIRTESPFAVGPLGGKTMVRYPVSYTYRFRSGTDLGTATPSTAY